jgi:Ca2+-binding RTX toxin-like protein
MGGVPVVRRSRYLVSSLTVIAGLLVLSPAPQAATSYTCGGKVATIVGTEGPDVIMGVDSPGPDVIVTLGGDDHIEAGGGDDTVCAGEGNDYVRGMKGDDYIVTGLGDDTVTGSNGWDTILLGPGNDVAWETNGFEFGYSACALIRGGKGNDTMTGGYWDHCVFYGEAGNDDLYSPAPGADRLYGGGGADTLDVTTFDYNGEPYVDERDVVRGGRQPAGGVDECSYQPEDSVRGCELKRVVTPSP